MGLAGFFLYLGLVRFLLALIITTVFFSDIDAIWSILLNVFKDKSSEPCLQYVVYIALRFFVILFSIPWIFLGAITAGLLWPSDVRKWLWDRHSTKDDESMKNSIQHIKSILAFEEKGSLLESKLNSISEEMSNLRDIRESIQKILSEVEGVNRVATLPERGTSERIVEHNVT